MKSDWIAMSTLPCHIRYHGPKWFARLLYWLWKHKRLRKFTSGHLIRILCCLVGARMEFIDWPKEPEDWYNVVIGSVRVDE